MASNVLSNPDDRASYDREIGVAGPSRDEDLDEAGPTSEYEIPMGVRRKQHRHFDIEDGIRLSILRTGGGTLTFTTTASEQVVIKGNPPPFSEVREGELMIAASSSLVASSSNRSASGVRGG